jgi:ferredoxin
MSTEPATDRPMTLDDSGLDDELGWLDEGLFVRDMEGRLIRYDKPTREAFEKKVTATIDGHVIEVRKAVPLTDEMGKPLLDDDGQVIPRATTVYDAVSQLYERLGSGESAGDLTTAKPVDTSEAPQDPEELKRAAGDKSNPIPVLCHMKYMQPVAVCRVCVVQIARLKRSIGKIVVDDKLLPACQHRVEEGMIIDTIRSPKPEARDRIEKAVRSLISLLLSDHPTPCAKEKQRSGDCELEALARQFGVAKDQIAFPSRKEDLPTDLSSLVISVDHNACILCDRCIRGCDVIKENHVLGRMGKGYSARIAFDLGTTMGSSTCVACGECMVSCPTGALTFKEAIEANWYEEDLAGSVSVSRKGKNTWFDWFTLGMFRKAARPLERGSSATAYSPFSESGDRNTSAP